MTANFQEARILAIEIDELMTAAFLDTGPIPIKCMMKLMGLLPANEQRLPTMPATAELENQLKAVVKRDVLAVKRAEVSAEQRIEFPRTRQKLYPLGRMPT